MSMFFAERGDRRLLMIIASWVEQLFKRNRCCK